MFGFFKRQSFATPVAVPPTFSSRPMMPRPQFSPRATRKKFGTDHVGLVGFHDNAFIIARPAEPFAAWLQKRAMGLHERLGGTHTNISAGLRAATEMFGFAPAGVLRKIFLLSDGEPNLEVANIMPAVAKAREARININAIGVGDGFDEALLRAIAAGTHNGRFVSVQSLRELTDALIANGNRSSGRMHSHRSETCIVVCDCSYSMTGPMDGKTKIAVVEEAVLRLLAYKQQLFA